MTYETTSRKKLDLQSSTNVALKNPSKNRVLSWLKNFGLHGKLELIDYSDIIAFYAADSKW